MKDIRCLWAPWRMQYISSPKNPKEEAHNASHSTNSSTLNSKSCVFCSAHTLTQHLDAYKKALVLYKGKTALVIMNKFPYNNGHIMIVPYRHTASFETLSTDEAGELFALIQRSICVLKQALSPEAFNVGLNLGKEAGAGIIDHLHIHIVPRWCGDTNFFPIIAGTKSMPEYLQTTYEKLYPLFSCQE